MPPVFRFAPSPNGYLHLGHALSALLNGDMAQAAGGRLLLRIEDIDAARCRPEYERALDEDLGWLGFDWERPVRRQSEHLDAYRDALERLRARGLVYPSYESRGEIARLVAEREAAGGGPGSWPRDPDGAPLYPLPPRHGVGRPGEAAIWRLDMMRALAEAGPLSWRETGMGPDGKAGTVPADPARWGDVVLARRETPTSYHLSVVVDDALQTVTHVVRGQDLFHATAVHRLLQVLLGLPAPVYRHHRLMMGADGRKLSKRDGATALRALRAAGATPADIRRRVGLLSGTGPDQREKSRSPGST